MFSVARVAQWRRPAKIRPLLPITVIGARPEARGAETPWKERTVLFRHGVPERVAVGDCSNRVLPTPGRDSPRPNPARGRCGRAVGVTEGRGLSRPLALAILATTAGLLVGAARLRVVREVASR